VVLNNLINIFGRDLSIPNFFGIDHHANPFGTLIEATRFVDPNFPAKFQTVNFALQPIKNLIRTPRSTTPPRIVRLPLVQTNKDMAPEAAHFSDPFRARKS
jgi:hypothetical protein